MIDMKNMQNELPIGNWMKASKVLSYLSKERLGKYKVEERLSGYVKFGYYETSLLRRIMLPMDFQKMECTIPTYMVFAPGKSPCPNCGGK
jgi:hypothetical protein